MPRKKKSNIEKYNDNNKKVISIRGVAFELEQVATFAGEILEHLRKKAERSNSKRLRKRLYVSSSSIYRVINSKHCVSVHRTLDWLPLRTKPTYIGRMVERSITAKLFSSFANFHAPTTSAIHSEYPFLSGRADGVLKLVECEECQQLLEEIKYHISLARNSLSQEPHAVDLREKVTQFTKLMCCSEKILLEVKVMGPYQFARNFTGGGQLKRTGEIYCQIQYLLYIYGVSKCILLVKRSHLKDYIHEIIQFAPEFIEKTLGKVKNFYVRLRLPYLFYKHHMREKHKLRFQRAKIMGIASKWNKSSRLTTKNRFYILSEADATLLQNCVSQNAAPMFDDDSLIVNKNAKAHFQSGCHADLKALVLEILEFDVNLTGSCYTQIGLARFNDILNLDWSTVKIQVSLEYFLRTSRLFRGPEGDARIAEITRLRREQNSLDQANC